MNPDREFRCSDCKRRAWFGTDTLLSMKPHHKGQWNAPRCAWVDDGDPAQFTKPAAGRCKGMFFPTRQTRAVETVEV